MNPEWAIGQDRQAERTIQLHRPTQASAEIGSFSSEFRLRLKRNDSPMHNGDGTTMLRRRQTKGQFTRGESALTRGQDGEPSFQLTMLRAFLLPVACRDVYVLKDIQGYTLPEVATVLGISKDEATKHLRRARREMQTS